MNMTTDTESTSVPRKAGRPAGSFGPRRRQLELMKQYIDALGGSVTPQQESDICRAVALQSIAEGTRARLARYGAQSTEEIKALARLESVAENAVRRLKLPVKAINTRTDT